VSALADNAVRITVHNAAQTIVNTATNAPAFVTTGQEVKADATASYDAANASAGCSAATRNIAVVFR
ncbi:MAG: hypothetical protein N2690_05820, partial [Rhodocyclaceae bacterium]|nr:hypothetical protein [Rhodocyclaceae bacterium]